MNLFKMHNKPEKLAGYDKLLNNPAFIWYGLTDFDDADNDDYFSDLSVLDDYAHVLAKHPYYAYMYAHAIMNEPFPEGEDAIATSGEYSYKYASEVLFTRFLKGEEAIMKSEYADNYKNQMQMYGDEV